MYLYLWIEFYNGVVIKKNPIKANSKQQPQLRRYQTEQKWRQIAIARQEKKQNRDKNKQR